MNGFFPASHNEQRLRLLRGGLVAGVVALVACIVGAFFSPQQFFRAYLSAYLLVLGLGLGSLVVLMIYHLTGAAWGFLLRRTLEAAARTLPLLAILFIPIGFGMTELYPWARPEAVEASENLQHKAIYLNVPFVWGRAVLFFVLWIGTALLLNVWSRRQDREDSPHMAERMAGLSGPGLVIYGLSVTFASVDWVMSLQPTFHSTIFGPIVASGQLLSAFALAILAFAWVSKGPPIVEFVSKESLNDIGNLLFTFLIIWAYMVFFQFMLIWIANLPSEVAWYLPRSDGGWFWVTWAPVVFHLIVPFFLLLDARRQAAPAGAGTGGRPGPVHATGVRLLAGAAVLSEHDPGRPLDGLPDARRTGRVVAGEFPVGVAALSAVAAAPRQPGHRHAPP